MASSSYSAPASSSGSCNYDVFLSFRGEDTRKTFVDHLYSALIQKTIHTYKDDEELPRGESIGPSLFNAINESKIAVIIFSKNYADSSWCLEELAYIIKCKNEKELIVMPVFYDVEPSEVRKQEGAFGKGFAKQEVKNITKVESWRKALFAASEISGWETKNIADGRESVVIKTIVDTILDKLLSLSSYVDDEFVGMTTRIQDLISRLEIGADGVRMVGIWGIGGGGKTTLATSVYTQISHHFEGSCIVENVREESSKDGLKKLQKDILSAVFKTEVNVPSVVEGKHKLRSMLCRRKVLVLLDDVDQLGQLEALAGSHSWFGSGSRIIITTRDEHLLKAHYVYEVCPLRLLSDKEAMDLFNKHAHTEKESIKGYEELSLRVVSYAAGLPLALKVLGSFLCDKDEKEWRSTLCRLKDIPELEIVEILKISYDGLKTIEKELFLDIACFFRGRHNSEAAKVLDACGFHPEIGIKVLRQKSLITINADGKFDMHDLVQEMAHYIVRGKHPHNPENHSRVWKIEEIRNMCLADATKGEAIENGIMLFGFHGLEIENSKGLTPSLHDASTCRLKLPKNWRNEFCGFLIYAVGRRNDKRRYNYIWDNVMISVEQVKSGSSMDSQHDAVEWKKNDGRTQTWVGYVSFASLRLRDTPWWNQTYNELSFHIRYAEGSYDRFGVRLVGRKSESPKHPSQICYYTPRLSINHVTTNGLTIFLQQNYNFKSVPPAKSPYSPILLSTKQ